MRIAAVVLVIAVTMAVRPSLAEPPRGPIVRSPEFISSVNRAIERGVAWLRRVESPSPPGWRVRAYDTQGYAGGTTALGVYALRACGVPRDDPRVQAELESLRQTFYEQLARRECRTYTVAIMCLAAAEQDLPSPDGNSGATSDREARRPLPRGDVKWLQDMVDWLERAQGPSGAWSYDVNASGSDGSNTQYALLALRAARRAGVLVKDSTWRKAIEWLLDAPEPAPSPGADESAERARGWGYGTRTDPYGSMTSSGVAGVVICASEMAERGRLPDAIRVRSNRAQEDGLAWLARRFSAPGPYETPVNSGRREARSGGPVDVHQYLYAVERAGELGAAERFGEHDWYGIGATFLVDSQFPSGAWSQGRSNAGVNEPGGDVESCHLATCFALLFLKRSTVPVRAETPSSAPTDPDFASAPLADGAAFSGFVGRVMDSWRNSAATASRERLAVRLIALGPRVVPPLIARLRDADEQTRAGAAALLHRATGETCGFDALAPGPDRDRAIRRWEQWWLEHGPRLAYDAASGMLTAR